MTDNAPHQESEDAEDSFQVLFEVATTMLKRGANIKMIKQATGLSEKQILKIKAEI